MRTGEGGRCIKCGSAGGGVGPFVGSWKEEEAIIIDGVRNWRGSGNDGGRQIAVCIGKRDLDRAEAVIHSLPLSRPPLFSPKIGP